jgi:hypothetical protein
MAMGTNARRRTVPTSVSARVASMSASSERRPAGRPQVPGPVPVAGPSGEPTTVVATVHNPTIARPDTMAAAASR